MTELMTGSLVRVQQERKIEARVRHIAAFTIAVTALLAVLGGVVLYAQGQNNFAQDARV